MPRLATPRKGGCGLCTPRTARLRAKPRKQGHPEWIVPHISLEESASGITDYSCTFLMGLLQTPEYATAVISSAFPRETGTRSSSVPTSASGVRILPYMAGAAPSHLPFTLLSLNDAPHALSTESPAHGGRVDDTPSAVAAAVSMFDRLRMAALSEEESLTLIRTILEEHTT
ncbi:Scr1 family TA system antitoxin-like transcriptional regulator [Streptomyces sp. NPDC058195]|uniref:Scr1 family TA system antitoxin-like transcriptional regulator n=1 Tax=Streptomyces sp. NPDC058195 TaxID=3346375 RepID=UPI0036E75E72